MHIDIDGDDERREWPWRRDFQSVEDLRTYITEDLVLNIEDFKTWPLYKWNKDKIPFLDQL